MDRFEKYEEGKQKIMAEFANFMRSVIERRSRTIVRNYLRGQVRNSGVPIEELDEENGEHCASDLISIPEEEFERVYRMGSISIGINDRTVAKILDELTGRERALLLLGIGLDLSTKELARAMGISAGSAEVMKSRALKKARKAGRRNEED